jgi:alkanesulfonate monooxygenase SsuD/methylene tetrahydromethanopterin reductase-like flavin-dependent oxidoreductase (luciferase family)
MILDIFSELQRPRPFAPDHEARAIADAIEQAQLADRLGFGCWWTVEHHGAVEFSYSSAPELMLAVLSQHTERIRFGHSGVLAPFKINHPLRVAERAAWVDVLSRGRLEMGLARSGGTEWEAFGVDADTSREQLREALCMLPRMWTQDSFKWESPHLVIPERNVVPKPLQKPHPPLWQTCTSPESFAMAGELGVGALATTLLSPLSLLAELFEHYAAGLAHCRPAGLFVNDRRSVFTFLHCAETRAAAIASRAAEAALWFVNAAPVVFRVPRSVWIDAIRGQAQANDPAATRAVAAGQVATDMDLDDPVPVIRLLNRQMAGYTLDPVEVYEALEPMESVIIGDVELCRRKLARYAALGTDRLMCLMQFGTLSHARAMQSLRVVGDELLPDFSA